MRECGYAGQHKNNGSGYCYLCTLALLGLTFGCTQSESEAPPRREDPIPDLIKALAEGGRNARLDAVKVLGGLGAKASPAAPALVTATRDPDEEIRWRAVEALGKIHADSKITLPIFRAALKDATLSVRLKAVEALESITSRCPQALEELNGALGSECKEVRQDSAVALLRIRPLHKKALQTLKQLIEENDPARSSTILDLRRLRGTAKPLTPALIACLKDKDTGVREAATQILGEIKADPTVVVPALAGALKDHDEYVRTFAAQSLGRFGAKAKRAVPGLIEVSKKDKSDMCRTAAIQALGEIVPPDAASATVLAELLADKNPNIRLFAAQSLGQIGAGAKDVAPALAKLAKNDPNREVRLMAIQGLLGIGKTSKVVIPTLKELLRDPDEKVRHGASVVLERLGEKVEQNGRKGSRDRKQ